MKEYHNPHDIANTVRMIRPMFTGAVVLVEGDTDARVYGKFTDSETCHIMPTFGKSNALGALDILRKDNREGVVTIVDNDFWALDNIEPEDENIFVTDTHDLETMIISSPAFDTVLDEFGSRPRIEKLRRPVTELLLDAALPIGYLRWLSSPKKENLYLSFHDLDIPGIIDRNGKPITVDIGLMLKILRRTTHGTPFNIAHVRKKLDALLQERAHDPWQVARGHDLVHILAVGLREFFGNRVGRTVTYDQIDRILRLSYGFLEFAASKLYESLKKWESNHPRYKILTQ